MFLGIKKALPRRQEGKGEILKGLMSSGSILAQSWIIVKSKSIEKIKISVNAVFFHGSYLSIALSRSAVTALTSAVSQLTLSYCSKSTVLLPFASSIFSVCA